jgi:hypothetical protein
MSLNESSEQQSNNDNSSNTTIKDNSSPNIIIKDEDSSSPNATIKSNDNSFTTNSNDNSSEQELSSNCSEVTTINSPTDSLNSNNIRISDAGIYSLCGLTSILFNQLFSEESNREFCKDTISALLNHLGLSSNQVKNSMYALLEGEGGNSEDFICLLKNEELLKSSCVPLIESLILFAIRDGVYDARLRVLILKIADLFNIPKELVQLHEESVVEMLSNEQPTQSDEELKEKAKRLRNKKIKKYLLIAGGTVVGGAVLGLYQKLLYMD